MKKEPIGSKVSRKLTNAELHKRLEKAVSEALDARNKLKHYGEQVDHLRSCMAAQEAEIASLKADSDVLAAARQKSAIIANYKLVLTEFNDAYGPGKAPTTPKLKAIESLIISLKDSQLYGSWLDFSRCSIITECDAAKARLSENVNSSVNSLTYQIADIVAKK